MQKAAALLAAIRADSDNRDNYLVYADILTGSGDPRGELITLQQKLADAADEGLAQRAQEILAANDHFVGGVDDQLFTIGWRWGFIDLARFFNYRDWMDSSFDCLPLVRRVFSSKAALVRELRLGVIRWMENGIDVPNILAEVAKLDAAPHLKRLYLGDVADIDCDLAHHPLGDLSLLGSAYPNLEVLSLHGCEFDFEKLPASLTSLSIETCGLTSDNFAAITRQPWARLETLSLWFGSEDYGAGVDIDGLAPLLAGEIIPAVRRLGLANAEFTDELCEVLPRAPVLKQLTALDLSMGVMSDAGARALAAHPDAFAGLAELDVRENFLTGEGIELLESLPCAVLTDNQKELDAGDPEWRYVSAAE